MNRLAHWVAHKFGWNTGEVVTFWRGERLMVCFRCSECGRVDGVHESAISKGLIK